METFSPEPLRTVCAQGTLAAYQDFLTSGKTQKEYVPAFDFADLYARLGDRDRAFENLEKAFAERGHNLAFIKVEPGLDNLRSDPRYANLLRRMGLPQ